MAKKALVVYYTYTNGNTERIAKQAANALGADIEEIEPETPYSSDHDAVVSQAKNEVDRGYQPKIKPLKHDLANYDIIVVGTPTWWYTMASPVLTFLSTNDFQGKTVVPFMTNAGWPGTVIDDMVNAASGADIACEKEFKFDSGGGSTMETSSAELNKWLDSLRKLL